MTRRRDILYGSFRASIKPPFINPTPGFDKGYGSGFEFAIAYNDSERMHINILTHDYMPNSTLGWSFAAARWDDAPVTNNLTYFHNFTETNSTIFLEHRMEWLNNTVIQYKNNAANKSVSFFERIKGKNTINLPSTPAPVSLQAGPTASLPHRRASHLRAQHRPCHVHAILLQLVANRASRSVRLAVCRCCRVCQACLQH